MQFKLLSEQEAQLERLLEQHGFLCGEALVPPAPADNNDRDAHNLLRPGWQDTALRTPKQGHGLFVRQDSTSFSGQRVRCCDPVERLYYTSNSFEGSKSVCAFCSEACGTVDAELAKCFKVVLPICTSCRSAGRKPFLPACQPGGGWPSWTGSEEGQDTAGSQGC